MEPICRVCLQVGELMVNIYGEEDLSVLLEKCGGIKVDRNDIYAKYLCQQCTTELFVSAKFREKCECTQNILQQINEELQEASAKEQLTLVKQKPPDKMESNNSETSNSETFDCNALGDNIVVVESEEQNEEIDQLNEFVMVDDEVGDLIVFAPDDDDKDEAIQNKILIDVLENNEESTVIAADCNLIEDDHMNEIIEIVEMVESNSLNVATAQATKFVCENCGAAFVQANSLKRHMEEVHSLYDIISNNLEEQPNISNKKTCSYCGKQMQSNFALQMHIRTHTNERPFKCELCEKAFKTQAYLKTHLKRHSGIPDFYCSECNKRFYEISSLKAHIRIHTGEKPHSCTVCNKSFSRVFLLQLHMRTHTLEKPYKCEHCEKAFAQLCDKKNHVKIHTGERPFKCHIPGCPRTFIKRYSLLLHLEKHASLNPDID